VILDRFRLTDRVAVVTGAGRGIGEGIALAFAEAGANVVCAARTPAQIESVAARVRDLGQRALAVPCDVTERDQLENLVAQTLGEFGRIDLLVNNAGVMGPRTGFGEIDYDGWLPVFETNTLAPMRMVEGFVEQVAKSGRKLIVNISSIMGSIGENASGGAIVYRSSKAALNAVIKSLSIDLAARGVTAVAFHPGWVSTDMGGASAPIGPAESVGGMRRVIERLTPADNGRFLDYDGSEIPW